MTTRYQEIKIEDEIIKKTAIGKLIEHPNAFFKPKKLLKAEIIQNAIQEEKKSKTCVIL